MYIREKEQSDRERQTDTQIDRERHAGNKDLGKDFIDYINVNQEVKYV